MSEASHRYQYDADVLDPDTGLWLPLPVTGITPTIDKDRVPYAITDVALAALTLDMIAFLDARKIDPHGPAPVRWRIARYTAGGTLVDTFPDTGYAYQWPRSLTRRLTSAHLTLHGGETLVDDKTNLTGRPLTLSTGTWAGLVDSGLAYVFGTAPDVLIDDAAECAMQLSSRFTHDMPPGRTVADIIETELNAQGLRLYDLLGTWWVADRDRPPGSLDEHGDPRVIALASHDSSDLDPDVDPAITDLYETITRDGDWSDGLLVRLGIPGAAQWWQQTATLAGLDCDGPTKGRVLDVPYTPASGNYAATVLARAYRKGRDLQITARARLDILPGMTLRAHLRGETLEATVSAVSWDFPAGLVTITTQDAITTPAIDATEDRGTTPTATTALARAEQIARTIPTPADIRGVTTTQIRDLRRSAR
ncbi:hypothetical protein [Microbacterium sp. No. 7]|uniref:hypothetical protein n=1 Tax=Microbacterium sp. No. 7 TaxID=1714373 RepID=UPI0006CFCF97|nr:hypothetical protein [Microbacterium sp. No. 7]ALJ20322.1 hypothetical protein AOA12_10525 [Microbacterium sp. No. 7]